MSDTFKWYVLRVKHQCEYSASRLLREKGYEDFVPRIRADHRWSDRRAQVELPLFPGYIFCKFDPRIREACVVTTPGVTAIVRFGRTPAPVEDAEIISIQRIVESQAPAHPWPYLQDGDLVRIDSGAMAGIEGVYLATKRKHRVVVSVTILQRSVAVEVENCLISPIARRHLSQNATKGRFSSPN